MNVLFFLTPKNKVEYVYDYYSMRQALEKCNITSILPYLF